MARKSLSQERASLASIRLEVREEDLPCGSAKARVLRNLLVVSVSFLLLFTAYQSLQNLQSSINAEQGLGTYSLATIYIALVVSCMFVPSYMIRRLGLKYTMVSAMSMYLVYFFANIRPMWITLLPASVILGTGGAPLWTAKCSYLSTLAQEYSDLVGALDAAPFLAGFFGVFFTVFQTTQIWGNLIAYVVLRPPVNASRVTASLLEHCGSTFHPTDELLTINATYLGSVTPDQISLLSALYACCVLTGILIMILFLDPIAKEIHDTSPPMQLLVETIKHMSKGYQQMLIPLTIYSGLQQAFFSGDYTQAYISCSWGVEYIGFVMISYGVTDALCSMASGFLVKMVGRMQLILLAALLNAGMMVRMLTWQPTPQESYNYFVIAVLWAMADASWQTQINSYYGILFADAREAAFANYRLWESMGFIIMFSVQSQLRLYVKVIGLMSTLLVGVLGYLFVEFHESAGMKSPI